MRAAMLFLSVVACTGASPASTPAPVEAPEPEGTTPTKTRVAAALADAARTEEDVAMDAGRKPGERVAPARGGRPGSPSRR